MSVLLGTRWDRAIKNAKRAYGAGATQVKAVGAVTRAQGRYLGQRISVTLHQLDGPDLTFKSIEEPDGWFRGLLPSLSG